MYIFRLQASNMTAKHCRSPRSFLLCFCTSSAGYPQRLPAFPGPFSPPYNASQISLLRLICALLLRPYTVSYTWDRCSMPWINLECFSGFGLVNHTAQSMGMFSCSATMSSLTQSPLSRCSLQPHPGAALLPRQAVLTTTGHRGRSTGAGSARGQPRVQPGDAT